MDETKSNKRKRELGATMTQPADWEASPVRELVRLAWPICVSMLSYSTMTLADTAFVASLGRSALSGVGLAGVMSFAVTVFGIGMLRAVKIVASQAVGAGDMRKVTEIAGTGILLAGILTVATFALGQLVVWGIPQLAASTQAGVHAQSYLFIRLLGVPLLFVFSATREYCYALGNSRSPMLASVLANLVNIGLDYVFIIQIEIGSDGAAWATLIATCVEAGALLWMSGAPGFAERKSVAQSGRSGGALYWSAVDSRNGRVHLYDRSRVKNVGDPDGRPPSCNRGGAFRLSPHGGLRGRRIGDGRARGGSRSGRSGRQGRKQPNEWGYCMHLCVRQFSHCGRAQ